MITLSKTTNEKLVDLLDKKIKLGFNKNHGKVKCLINSINTSPIVEYSLSNSSDVLIINIITENSEYKFNIDDVDTFYDIVNVLSEYRDELLIKQAA